jgi:DNA-binding transcriptional MerR regulator
MIWDILALLFAVGPEIEAAEHRQAELRKRQAELEQRIAQLERQHAARTHTNGQGTFFASKQGHDGSHPAKTPYKRN